jgi:hypothetical protein
MESTPKFIALVVGVAMGISLAIAVLLTYTELGTIDLIQTVEAAKSGTNTASQGIGQSQRSDSGGNNGSDTNTASQGIGKSLQR